MRIQFKIVLFLMGMVYTFPSFAHGDLHARIQRVSKEIKAQPDSAYLYLKRGKLYLQHHDYAKAIADLEYCSTLEYQSVELDYSLASAFVGAGKNDQALEQVNRLLTEHKDHTPALRLKAQLMMQQGQFQEAALLFDEVLYKSSHLVAEFYLDASRAWEQHGGVAGEANAEGVIHAGIATLGALSIFYERLVELHWNQDKYTSALAFQDELIDMLQRKEHGYFVRARLHLAFGNLAAANADATSALQAIQSLPKRIRRHKAIIELKQSALQLLAQTGKTTN